MEESPLLYLISPPVIEDISRFAEVLERVLLAGKGVVGAFQLRLKDQSPEHSFTPRGEGKEGGNGAAAKDIIDAFLAETSSSPHPSSQGEREPSRYHLTLPPAPENYIREVASMLIPICHAHDIPFILNDAPELAREVGADGVHLGQEDGGIAHARKILGDSRVIGATCHDSRHLAMEAGEQGADYVAFGAFYPTTSKTPAALAHWGTPTPDILHWWSTYTTVPCVAIGGITPHNVKPLIDAGADFLAIITSVWKHAESPVTAIEEFKACLR